MLQYKQVSFVSVAQIMFIQCLLSVQYITSGIQTGGH